MNYKSLLNGILNRKYLIIPLLIICVCVHIEAIGIIPIFNKRRSQLLATDFFVYCNICFANSIQTLTSCTASEPAGILYSNSIVTGMLYFLFFNNNNISFIGVSPSPHFKFAAPFSLFLRSLRCRLEIRLWFFSIKANKDSVVLFPPAAI